MTFIPRPPPAARPPSSLPEGFEDWTKSSASPVLLTTLAELARVAARGVGTETLLRELAQLTMLATTVDGAGTMSCTGTTMTFVHADNPRTASVDQLQEKLQQGPCLTSVQTQQPVAVRDFSETSARQQWPDLAPAALEAGFHSTLAVPLLARGQAWGVLDIYRDQPHRWTFADLLISKTLAEVVVSLLVLVTDLDRARAPGPPPATTDPRISPVAASQRGSGETGSSARVELLRATLDARFERLNARLSTARDQLAKPPPPSE